VISPLPLPKKVCAIAAHPDDIEYSCLGLLNYLFQQNVIVHCFVASTGSILDPTSGEERYQEAITSLSGSGYKLKVIQENTFDYLSLESQIRSLVLTENIDLVLVHDPNDTHQEHRLMYEVTVSALRRTNVSLIRYRSVSSTSLFVPNLFLDISKFIPEKLSMLSKHVSQSQKSYMTERAVCAFHSLYFRGSLDDRYYEQFHVEGLFI
jgi:LmbE family N-acetylglucosaminyl deacetylase